MPIARRIVCVVFAFAMSCGCGAPHSPGPPNSADTAKSDAVMRVVRNFMTQAHLRAAIVRVTVDG
jgi:hypothetical protein